MRNQEEEKFLEFYEKWMDQLEQHLQQLMIAQELIQNPNLEITPSEHEHDELRGLISKLTAHHKAYYMVKWAAIGEDVMTFFGSVWLSPLEKAYFWLTGWKPSTAFRFLDRIRKSRRPPELSEAQVQKLDELRLKMRLEEEKVEREMERYQVAMADRKILQLARIWCHVSAGGVEAAEAVVNGLAAALQKLVKAADCVRLKTLKGILDILQPPQSVHFLAAMSAFQVQLRRWGVQRCSTSSSKLHSGC